MTAANHPFDDHQGHMTMSDEPLELTVTDARAWREWLSRHHDSSAGVWLVLAKQNTTRPTSLTYDQALDEALCHGWIDGRLRRRDDITLCRRFTLAEGKVPGQRGTFPSSPV
ncbi:YdeI family protein [Streptosporangium lutulentum]